MGDIDPDLSMTSEKTDASKDKSDSYFESDSLDKKTKKKKFVPS